MLRTKALLQVRPSLFFQPFRILSASLLTAGCLPHRSHNDGLEPATVKSSATACLLYSLRESLCLFVADRETAVNNGGSYPLPRISLKKSRVISFVFACRRKTARQP